MALKSAEDHMIKKIKIKTQGPVWYMCLKTENCYLKIFIEIRVGEKIYKNT